MPESDVERFAMKAVIDGIVCDPVERGACRLLQSASDGRLVYELYENMQDDHGFVYVKPLDGVGGIIFRVTGGEFRRLCVGGKAGFASWCRSFGG